MRSPTFSRHVLLLALAAVFGFGQRTYAKVLYTPVNIHVVGTGILKIDLNHDGLADLSIVFSGRSVFCPGTGPGAFGSVYALPATGNGTVANSRYVLALTKGTSVNSSRAFYPAQGLLLQASTCLYPPHVNLGAWQSVYNRYMGIRFQINGKSHYGWARLSVFLGRSGPVITMTGYAYETVSGAGILAGQNNE